MVCLQNSSRSLAKHQRFSFFSFNKFLVATSAMFNIHVFTIYVYIWLSQRTQLRGVDLTGLQMSLARPHAAFTFFTFILLVHTWARGTLHQSINPHS